MSITVEETSFVATGVSDSVKLHKSFNVSIDFSSGEGSGVVRLERSFDKGERWYVMGHFDGDASHVVEEPEHGVEYRLNCIEHTSGTIQTRLSR